jgi:hypothetical protein
MFANHVSDKGIMTNYIKKLAQLSSKKLKKNWIKNGQRT